MEPEVQRMRHEAYSQRRHEMMRLCRQERKRLINAEQKVSVVLVNCDKCMKWFRPQVIVYPGVALTKRLARSIPYAIQSSSLNAGNNNLS